MWPFLPGIVILTWAVLLYVLPPGKGEWARYRPRMVGKDPARKLEAERVGPQVLLVTGSLGVNAGLSCWLLDLTTTTACAISVLVTVVALVLGAAYLHRYLAAGQGRAEGGMGADRVGAEDR